MRAHTHTHTRTHTHTHTHTHTRTHRRSARGGTCTAHSGPHSATRSHYVTLYYITLYSISLHYITLYFIALRHTILHYYITLCKIVLHYMTFWFVVFFTLPISLRFPASPLLVFLISFPLHFPLAFLHLLSLCSIIVFFWISYSSSHSCPSDALYALLLLLSLSLVFRINCFRSSFSSLLSQEYILCSRKTLYALSRFLFLLS
jgi:hypothetical protein